MANNKLKAYVRYDGTGRIIPGSLILNRFKPKVGNWQEIDANECCNYAPTNTFNFDITANWSLTTPAVVDEASFKTFLESGQDGDGNSNNQTDVVITDFLLEGNRLRCNVSSTGGDTLELSLLNITDVKSFGDFQAIEDLYLYENNITSIDNTIFPIGVTSIYLSNNQITSFNPINPLPNSLLYLFLSGNGIISFNPSLPLPSSLAQLSLDNNNIVTFDPSVALPNSVSELYLNNNQIVTFDPSIALPSSLQTLGLTNNQIVTFDPTIALPSGLQDLSLSGNQIVTFNPTIALPNSLIYLYLINNQIVTFNPSIALPNSLQQLYLEYNQIVIFNPTLPLPDSLTNLQFDYNLMTTAGYTASEPWANAMSVIPGRGEIRFNNNINSASGTNLETVLTAKGWTVNT